MITTGRFVRERCHDAEQQLQEGAGHEENKRTELQIHALLRTHSCSVSLSNVPTDGQGRIKMIGQKIMTFYQIILNLCSLASYCMICPFMCSDIIDMQIPCSIQSIHVFIFNVLAVVLTVAIENELGT